MEDMSLSAILGTVPSWLLEISILVAASVQTVCYLYWEVVIVI